MNNLTPIIVHCNKYKNMCLAIPGKIIKVINPDMPIKYALIQFEGIQKEICIAWVDAKEGDYVLTHAGIAISVIDQNEANLTLEALKLTGDVR